MHLLKEQGYDPTGPVPSPVYQRPRAWDRPTRYQDGEFRENRESTRTEDTLDKISLESQPEFANVIPGDVEISTRQAIVFNS